MDLRSYYQRIRETMAGLGTGDVWVESVATADGGKAGVFTQVPAQLAAKLIVDGKAKLADVAAAQAFEKKREAMQAREPGVERMVVRLESAEKPSLETGAASEGKSRKPKA